MTQFICIVFLVALMASFLVLLLNKWGVVEWLQVHGDEWVSKMANCTFCLSFWVCFLLAVMVAVGTDNMLFLAVPFFACPITRFFVA